MCKLTIQQNEKLINFCYDSEKVSATDMQYPNIVKWVNLVKSGSAHVVYCDHPVSIDAFAEDFNNRLLFSLINRQ